MTTPFVGEDFLLECDAARKLYRDHAEPLPVIDYIISLTFCC